MSARRTLRLSPLRAGAAVAVLLCASPRQARAQNASADAAAVPQSPAAPAAPDEPQWRTQWYGWQTLLADAAATTVLLLPTKGSASDVSGAIGAGLFVLGAPALHLLHGRGVVALGDAGLRLVLPLIGALVGAAVATNSFEGPIDGLLVGMGCASVIDAALLAYARVRVEPDAVARGPHLRPVLGLRSGGGVAGVGLTF